MPAAGAGGGDEFVADGRNLTPTWAGEEVEILRRPGREVLCCERRSAGEQESAGCGQPEEHRGYLQLKAGQRGGVVGIGHWLARARLMAGDHAARKVRGRTNSDQRSTSSAPSTWARMSSAVPSRRAAS